MPKTVEFFGETFELIDEVSQFTLMEFAEASERVDSESLAGLAAVFRLLKDAIVPADWARFRSVARKNKATAMDCMTIVVSVFEDGTDRPTTGSSDSSDGPVTTAPSSVDSASSRAIARLEAQGRPDLALLVTRTQESRSA